jgi:hypothetical protein
MEPVEAARGIVAERFGGALAAFLGGGVLSEHRTATSDLDIVVLLAGPPAPFRESLRWRGWPVELFVHDPASIGNFFAKDTARRKPNLARMCTSGVVLADAGGVAGQIITRAQAVLAAGPAPLTGAELARRRYGLTDLLDDLAGSQDPGETAVISWQVFTEAAELALLVAGSWLGGGKWLLRELRAVDSELADGLIAALPDPPRWGPGGSSPQGNTERLTELADQVLTTAGGRLWAGYRVGGTS